MCHFLLSLHLEPVFIAYKAFVWLEICHVQVEIGREELFVNLFVKQFHYFFINHIFPHSLIWSNSSLTSIYHQMFISANDGEPVHAHIVLDVC